MSTLTLHRCLHHPAREAVARCPECGQFYCRECVTEHDDRLLCAGCLGRLHAAAEPPRPRHGWFSLLLGASLGLLAAWFIFYAAGRIFLALPEKMHQNSVWAPPEEAR